MPVVIGEQGSNAPQYNPEQLLELVTRTAPPPPNTVQFRNLGGKLLVLVQQQIGYTPAQAAQAGFPEGIKCMMLGGCSAVVFYNKGTKATFVYHAISSGFEESVANDALEAIQSSSAIEKAKVIVIVAHWGDRHYHETIDPIARAGVPQEQILEVKGLPENTAFTVINTPTGIKLGF